MTPASVSPRRRRSVVGRGSGTKPASMAMESGGSEGCAMIARDVSARSSVMPELLAFIYIYAARLAGTVIAMEPLAFLPHGTMGRCEARALATRVRASPRANQPPTALAAPVLVCPLAPLYPTIYHWHMCHSGGQYLLFWGLMAP